jgi:hypothetical protein
MPDISEINAPPAVSGVASQPEIVLGTLVRFDEAGAPLVDWPGNPGGKPAAALSTAPYTAADAGRTAALLFAGGDPARPLIVGLVREPMDAVFQATEQGAAEEAEDTGVEEPEGRPFEARVDGDRVVISAEKEIVLQCGKASITLTRAGKILLRGAYLLSRSSGVNRIKGGSVQIN